MESKRKCAQNDHVWLVGALLYVTDCGHMTYVSSRLVSSISMLTAFLPPVNKLYTVQ